ncbi:7477_t:CDS:2, partial [Funneliformis caledonium]
MINNGKELLNDNTVSVNDNVYNDESVDVIKEVLTNDDESDESNIEEDLVDDILEELSFDFKGFDSEYDSYFPNFTSHTCNFATLVGVKEIVHHTFKIMVSHMNCNWIDSHFSTRPNILSNLIADLNIYTILTGWYATENSSNIMNKQIFENECD